jgi:hypothetical protein
MTAALLPHPPPHLFQVQVQKLLEALVQYPCRCNVSCHKRLLQASEHPTLITAMLVSLPTAKMAALQQNFSDSTDSHNQTGARGNLGKFVESNDSTTDPTSFRDLVESNDPTTRSLQIPPDPTNIMRLGVKNVKKKCVYALTPLLPRFFVGGTWWW